MCLLKLVLSTAAPFSPAACVSNTLAEVGGRGEAVVWLLILAALRLLFVYRSTHFHHEGFLLGLILHLPNLFIFTASIHHQVNV